MLTINGHYTRTAAGVLQMELGGRTPGNGFDRLVVNGPATLAGALHVARINGFRPAVGDVLAVLSFGSRTGTFASMNGWSLGNGLRLGPASGPTALTLTAASSALTSPRLAFSRAVDGPFHAGGSTMSTPASAGSAGAFGRLV